jgi:HPt (histidine-containing phosphotransfer) domain-containing protein
MTGTRPSGQALDLVHLSAQTFGDRALEREVLDLFEQQCRRLLPAIADRSAIMARGDAAHTLKGAARAVGAERVAAIADAIEAAVERGSKEVGLLRLVGELELAVDEAAVAIRSRQQDAA